MLLLLYTFAFDVLLRDIHSEVGATSKCQTCMRVLRKTYVNSIVRESNILAMN